MSNGQPDISPVRKMGAWKRIALVGVAIALGLILFNWYWNRPTPPHNWPDIDNPSEGFKVTLKTEWRDGKTKYKLRVVPHDQSLAAAFDRVVRPAVRLSSFTAHLEDSSGFQLCEIQILKLVPEVGNDGLAHAAAAEGDAYGCSRTDYLEVQKWHVTYRFPKISASTSQDKEKMRQAEATTRNAGKSPVTYPLEGEDSLTGFDLSAGHIETRGGHTFLVQREGERMTALMWTVSARMKYACKSASDCLIENTDNGEAVHARVIR